MENIKINLGRKALEYIKDKQIVGLGTGSTANCFIEELSKANLNIKAVSSSIESYNLAKKLNIPLVEIDTINSIDIYVDGADQIDDNRNMIKGRGAAFFKEKILAYNSKKILIIADFTKKVKKIGNTLLPLEILPFAKNLTVLKLRNLNLIGEFRKKNNEFVITDSGNFILKHIPGVLETGLFLDFNPEILIGYEDRIETITNN